jgi:hypothetical protein
MEKPLNKTIINFNGFINDTAARGIRKRSDRENIQQIQADIKADAPEFLSPKKNRKAWGKRMALRATAYCGNRLLGVKEDRNRSVYMFVSQMSQDGHYMIGNFTLNRKRCTEQLESTCMAISEHAVERNIERSVDSYDNETLCKIGRAMYVVFGDLSPDQIQAGSGKIAVKDYGLVVVRVVEEGLIMAVTAIPKHKLSNPSRALYRTRDRDLLGQLLVWNSDD